MGTKYFYYKSRGPGGGPVTLQIDNTQIASMKNQLSDLSGQVLLAEIEEETYNEMYLNSKKNPATFGLFSKVGLRNTQDWVLAYFFFSYIVFSVLIILQSLQASVNRMLTLMTMSAIMISIGVFLYIFVRVMG